MQVLYVFHPDQSLQFERVYVWLGMYYTPVYHVGFSKYVNLLERKICSLKLTSRLRAIILQLY